ncbi:MAG: primosomal protein N' [Ruminococcaceae bacterium]|nr:primosomal protein N' [Oscillospiraceae bacterium]
MGKRPIARVCILDAPYNIDRQYDYYIPQELRAEVAAGTFVIVPFGKNNRRSMALVVSLPEESEYEDLKPVFSSVNGCISLSKEMLGLCAFIKEHTFCTVGDAVRCLLPGTAFAKLEKIYFVNGEQDAPAFTDGENDKARELYELIKSKKHISDSKLKGSVDCGVFSFLPMLLREGHVLCYASAAGSDEGRFVDWVSLNVSEEEAEALLGTTLMRRSTKQSKIISTLVKESEISLPELKKRFEVSAQQIDALAKKSLVKIERRDKYKAPKNNEAYDRKLKNELNECQKKAYEKLCELSSAGEAKAALLYGITGSGKTRVMISLIDKVLAEGRSAIVLIPEISLTPQTLGLFKAYYGDGIAIWHSSLSQGEKFDYWQRMRNGEIKLCIGTRSAVFAPLRDLGLIVIDEEQEHTYKSDMNPKYHAKDIARYRCAHNKAMMLLASATPSLESYYKAQAGVYTLVELKERYGDAKLPKTIIADLRLDSSQGKVGPIGSVLKDNLDDNIRNGEQSILFINRRGYNNFLNCPVCGDVLMCPHCSVSLTYHAKGGNRGKDGYLFCHYCGYMQSVPEKCPNCGNEKLRYIGFGTQKVEDELSEIIDGSVTLRMDADTTTKKDSYENMIDSFRKGEGNILLGTQMVTKGHDFPGVTLVGVLLADMSLYVDDFHANERSFAQITQVVGRAGRGKKPGRAVIQTYNPEHPVLKYAASQDYDSFYKNEIALRRALVYPPFCDMFLLSLTSRVESELLKCCADIKTRIDELMGEEYKDVKLILFGPFEAPVYKVNERYRMRFVAKGKSNARTRELIRKILFEFNDKNYKNINIGVDINPNSL